MTALFVKPPETRVEGRGVSPYLGDVRHRETLHGKCSLHNHGRQLPCKVGAQQVDALAGAAVRGGSQQHTTRIHLPAHDTCLFKGARMQVWVDVRRPDACERCKRDEAATERCKASGA